MSELTLEFVRWLGGWWGFEAVTRRWNLLRFGFFIEDWFVVSMKAYLVFFS